MERTTRNRIGRLIKAARHAKGLTAAELGRKVGVTENAIRKLESGSSKEPRFSTALLMADALDVDLDFMSNLPRKTRASRSAPELGFVIRQIRQCRDILRQRGVEHVRVFGSIARGDAGPRSDIDAIIEPASEAQFTLFDLAAAREILENALRCRVDVITAQTVRRSNFAEVAELEAVSAF